MTKKELKQWDVDIYYHNTLITFIRVWAEDKADAETKARKESDLIFKARKAY